MEYRVLEDITENRYSLTLTFAQNILPYFENGRFRIKFTDLVTSNIIDINDRETMSRFGLSAKYLTTEQQISDSLINNGGIVIYFDGNTKLNIVMIPCCEYNSRWIGFNTSKINISCGYGFSDETSVETLARLYPSIIRAKNMDTYIPGAADPILPANVSRPCYTFPNVYGKDAVKIDHTIRYDTAGDIYVNTSSENPGVEEVPLYTSTLSAYFVDGTDNMSDYLKIDSYIYNPEIDKKTDVPYEHNGPVTVRKDIVRSYTSQYAPEGTYYSVNLTCHEYRQKLFVKNKGLYKNELHFDISTLF